MASILVSSLVVILYIANLEIVDATKAVNVAPYINETHPCGTHAPGCQSELTNVLVRYTLDSKDGSLQVQKTATTEDNGFFTIVVPAKKHYNIIMSVTLDGTEYSGSTEFSSYTSSSDCITDGRLYRVS